MASMVLGTIIAANNGVGRGAYDWIVPVGFAVYACALIVTGGLARSRVTIAAGIGATFMVGLFTAMILSPDRYLLASVGVFLTVFVPGLVSFSHVMKEPMEGAALPGSIRPGFVLPPPTQAALSMRRMAVARRRQSKRRPRSGAAGHARRAAGRRRCSG